MALLDKKKSDRTKWAVRGLITTTIGELLLAPYLAYLIHQVFGWLFQMGRQSFHMALDFNYVNSWKMLFANPGVRMWFLIIELSYAFLITYIMIKPHAKISDVKTIEVTSKISIPIEVGNGQHGSARFATEKEKNDIYQTFVFSGKEQPQGKGGLVIEMKCIGNEEHIRYVGKFYIVLLLAPRVLVKQDESCLRPYGCS